MANMSAKFDEEAHNGLVCIVFTSLSLCVNCDLDLWPLASKINRVHPLVIVNMSAKFDEDVNNSLVAIVFIRIRCDARTDWRTHARTDGTTAALLYPLRNALRGDNKKCLMRIGHIPMGLKNTCIPWEKIIPWENLICGVECNLKYVLEKIIYWLIHFPFFLLSYFFDVLNLRTGELFCYIEPCTCSHRISSK